MPLSIRFLIFFVTLMVALGAAGAFVHRRASHDLGLGPWSRRALGALFVAAIGAILIGRLGPFEGQAAAAVTMFGFTIELGVIISAVLLLVVEGVRGTGHGAAALFRRVQRTPAAALAVPVEPQTTEATLPVAPPASVAPSPAIPRRAFITRAASGSAMLIGGSSSLYGSLFGRHDYQIEEVPVPIPNLPRSLDGYTIVQLSDIHFGTFVGDAELEAAVEHVRLARPDLVVLTGDLVDHDAAYAPYLGRLVRRLNELGRDGVAMIPGNHDYYAGVAEVLAAAEGGGAEVLVNGSRLIGDRGGQFALVGVDDVWTGRNGFDGGPDLDRALLTVPDDMPRVLLCHNPVFFPEAAGRVDLQLSGHTHGGQVNLVVNPAEVVLPYGYVAGLYERGGSTLYVNRGFGTAGPPSRVGSPPEITKLILTAA